MQSSATTVSDYLLLCPEDQKPHIEKFRKTILDNLPEWFQECINYGMIGYVVPHSIYPAGYHCDPKLPLPFLWLAYQKNSINFYHMGIYAEPWLSEWFTAEYTKHSSRKLDMGKSCIRFKKYDEIPYNLIGELCSKISVDQWITLYETSLKK
jgi:uncharacterized protein YdhG (YjbR/CyaY superfamily)